MKKYSIFSGLTLLILCSNSLLSSSALDDGYYFSEEIYEGVKIYWDVTRYTKNYELVTTSTDSNAVIEGTIISVEVIQTPTYLEINYVSQDLFVYFDEKYDGVVVNNAYEIGVLVKPAKYVSGGVEENFFEYHGYEIDENMAFLLEETTSGDNYSIEEFRYDMKSGFLLLMYMKDVIDGEVEYEYKLEILKNNRGIILDFSSYWFILQALMLSVIINKRRK
ncbi:MAG: hypothetical protein KAR35_04725 [Candidatus Heimdallarchaeota archaeon]|nr:hypothetical protein [Candidatus Heimdallarchaeota archaeon]MCK5048660.1 hypothetical protein [Candidatus Heimdallarchaeota archaeon]